MTTDATPLTDDDLARLATWAEEMHGRSKPGYSEMGGIVEAAVAEIRSLRASLAAHEARATEYRSTLVGVDHTARVEIRYEDETQWVAGHEWHFAMPFRLRVRDVEPVEPPLTVSRALDDPMVRSGAMHVRWDSPQLANDDGEPAWKLLRRDPGTPAWLTLNAFSSSWEFFEFDVADLDAPATIIPAEAP